MRALNLEQATTLIAATFAAAKKHKCRPIGAIVLDAGSGRRVRSVSAKPGP